MDRRLFLAVAMLAAAACTAQAGHGLVLHYDFNEGRGTVVRDRSGSGNAGGVHGAKFVKSGNGFALRFDGKDDYVEFLVPAAKTLGDAVTLELWVLPRQIPSREAGLLWQYVGVFGLTYYVDGRCYFYSGGKTVAAPLQPGTWHHIVGTYDRRQARLYFDGRLAASSESTSRTRVGKSFHIGSKGKGLNGLIDDARIYSRALSADEVASSYRRGRKRTLGALEMMKPKHTLEGAGFRVHVGPRGGVQIVKGDDVCLFVSSYSFPGERIGFNVLGPTAQSNERRWSPVLTRAQPDRIVIAARGPFYSLDREMTVAGGRIRVRDHLTNVSKNDVGVIVRYRIVPLKPPQEILLGGTRQSQIAEWSQNPTVFLRLSKGGLGVLAEDTVSRVQFEATASSDDVACALNHLALRPGETRTLKWALYPIAKGGYFDFINRVRRDWQSNYTVEGPFEFGPPYLVWQNPKQLRAYLKRKRLKITAPGPWLDYDCFDSTTGRLMTREKYKELMRRAMAAIKAIDPEIKVVGNMEGPLVSLPQEVVQALYEALPPDKRKAGYPKPFTDRQLEIIKDVDVRQRDSLVFGPDGRTYYELYFRGPKDNRTPLMAILVYPAPGNEQLKYWLEQARYLMEEVRLDGIYLDGGGPVRNGRYGYDRWDGVTVDIDARTGRITRRYTDFMRVIGNMPCRQLFDYVLNRGGTFVANGHHYTEEMQSYRIPRFLETGSEYDPLAIPDGTKPPLLARMCKGHLDAPVALANFPGSCGEKAVQNYARFVMKCVITHLRHGLLFYYYNTEIPESGPGSGEYGPINHMFPITPIELHEGWILGKERIISARSIDVMWDKQTTPVVHVFDLTGRAIDTGGRSEVREHAGKWRVILRLKDWAEIAVVE